MKALWPGLTSRKAKGRRESPRSGQGSRWGNAMGGSGMICVGLGSAKVTLSRPKALPASRLISSVNPSACCHARRYLSLYLNGFPRFMMTTQLLFMSWGPIAKTLNAGSIRLSSLCISQYTLIKREGSQQTKCCVRDKKMGGCVS